MRTVSVASDLFDFSLHFISFLIISLITLLFLLPDIFNFLDVADKYPAYFRWGPWHPGRERAFHSISMARDATTSTFFYTSAAFPLCACQSTKHAHTTTTTHTTSATSTQHVILPPRERLGRAWEFRDMIVSQEVPTFSPTVSSCSRLKWQWTNSFRQQEMVEVQGRCTYCLVSLQLFESATGPAASAWGSSAVNDALTNTHVASEDYALVSPLAVLTVEQDRSARGSSVDSQSCPCLSWTLSTNSCCGCCRRCTIREAN